MTAFFEQLWYKNHPLRWFLLPFSWCYGFITLIRRRYLELFCQHNPSVPVIVVGNVSVGGVGKTPLVIALAKNIRQKGIKVGVVSRGYGAKIKTFPYEIQCTDTALDVGDEPLMIAQKTDCPVVIAPNRMDAVHHLVNKHQVELIISDDGLQHYRMGRSIEIAVIDGLRGLGNRLLLPAGPLRESPARLNEVDFIIVNEGTWDKAYPMCLTPGKIIKLSTGEEVEPDELKKRDVAAIAGIGNPQRFYSTLTRLGIEFKTYSYPDHYQFEPIDFNQPESLIIMTEKDAVKCRSFSSDKMYYLPVDATLNKAFWDALWTHKLLKGYC
ncbi:tetraacyldisaccharide 4'-kinase [Legionella worsleiensis]|uniref:Tetraacyldisaccharide 4'-kinase n=1 Tax=Legionella worsleiensis TaxID=45076 RepID=A0A0W1AIY1_9GAMM|nr:tetraacyldisaccharide 4'-kinase [Legionella worsleiensis]KTD81214.1 tetraacyldisaccharide 4'-kinase [Legionella worsleiensis]STY33191.1 tetraacyldisaccharide 4'-kinase [Legionella worsleiensis]